MMLIVTDALIEDKAFQPRLAISEHKFTKLLSNTIVMLCAVGIKELEKLMLFFSQVSSIVLRNAGDKICHFQKAWNVNEWQMILVEIIKE